MSFWYEPIEKDISHSDDKKEIHIYLTSDESGAIYVSLETKVLEAYLKKLKKKPPIKEA